MRIFADESCTQPNDGGFMVIGCLTCDSETAADFRKEIGLLNSKISKQSEYHFANIGKHRTACHYKQLCDIFFDFHNQKCSYKRGLDKARYYRRVCFDAIIIDHKKTDHVKFSAGDSQIGFFRFYKTILLHIVKKHYNNADLIITMDEITLKKTFILSDLHQQMNKKLGDRNIIAKLQKQDSKAELLLQVADVLTGAVAFAWNRQECSLSTRNQAKLSVVQHIESRLGRSLTRLDSPGRSFNIWQLRMH